MITSLPKSSPEPVDSTFDGAVHLLVHIFEQWLVKKSDIFLGVPSFFSFFFPSSFSTVGL